MVFQIFKTKVSGEREVFFDIEYWIDYAKHGEETVYRPKIKVWANTPALMLSMHNINDLMYVNDTDFMCNHLSDLIKQYFNIDDWKDIDYVDLHGDDIVKELKRVINEYSTRYNFRVNVD
jgi:hypothetical protein